MGRLYEGPCVGCWKVLQPGTVGAPRMCLQETRTLEFSQQGHMQLFLDSWEIPQPEAKLVPFRIEVLEWLCEFPASKCHLSGTILPFCNGARSICWPCSVVLGGSGKRGQEQWVSWEQPCSLCQHPTAEGPGSTMTTFVVVNPTQASDAWSHNWPRAPRVSP
jgi:hypothetical protein